jgi:hypothetical protein
MTEEVTAAHGQNRDATCKLPLGTKEKFFEVCYAAAMAQLEGTLAGALEFYIGSKDIPCKGIRHRRVGPISMGGMDSFTPSS